MAEAGSALPVNWERALLHGGPVGKLCAGLWGVKRGEIPRVIPQQGNSVFDCLFDILLLPQRYSFVFCEGNDTIFCFFVRVQKRGGI